MMPGVVGLGTVSDNTFDCRDPIHRRRMNTRSVESPYIEQGVDSNVSHSFPTLLQTHLHNGWESLLEERWNVP